jgi:hypothetical protein
MTNQGTFPGYNTRYVQWHGEEVARIGGILELTIEPSDIGNMDEDRLRALARQCQSINNDLKTPIILRYGHECNGSFFL